MEPLAAQSGRTPTTKPWLRRKRLHPGYNTRRSRFRKAATNRRTPHLVGWTMTKTGFHAL